MALARERDSATRRLNYVLCSLIAMEVYVCVSKILGEFQARPRVSSPRVSLWEMRSCESEFEGETSEGPTNPPKTLHFSSSRVVLEGCLRSRETF